jgi:hypothetical protein
MLLRWGICACICIYYCRSGDARTVGTIHSIKASATIARLRFTCCCTAIELCSQNTVTIAAWLCSHCCGAMSAPTDIAYAAAADDDDVLHAGVILNMNAEERERQNGLRAINSLMAGVKVLYVYAITYVYLHFT